MTDFIDLRGASGKTYRFRAWADAGQTPMAGNFVVLEAPGRLSLVGVIDDLSRAPAAAGHGAPAEALFVRLNVSRTIRASEHEDLVAQHRPARVCAAD